MIDIHSHVLPGLDDGSPGIEESLRMVEVAAAAGTTDLVATPHANLRYRFDPSVVTRKLDELQAAAPPTIRLHYGCDLHLTPDNVQDALANPERYTINHRRYLLVEFPDLLIPKTSAEIFSCMLAAGIVPVITHPERNFLLHRRLDEVAGWVAQGCLVQVTAQSFLGRFGSEVRAACRALMERGLVHFVASDAHDSKDRPPRLDLARRHVERKYGAAAAERLFVSNPRAVLEGEPLPEPAAPGPERRRKWMKFWPLP
ncbi:MAG: tyrosine-protein phosphatase [Rhodospirillales bacterium]